MSDPYDDSLNNNMNPAEGDADQGENLTAEEEAEVRRRIELEKLKRKEQVQKRREEQRQKSSVEAGLKTKEGTPVVKPLAQAPAQSYAASEYDAQPAQLREDMIANAIPFLTNPRVVNSPEERKRKFLQFKGLNDAEIDEAMVRAGQTPISRGGQAQSVVPRPGAAQQQQQYAQPQQGYQQPNTMVRYQQPGPYAPPLPPPPPQQIQVHTPWKTIVFVALICTGLGNALVYFLRRLWRRFFGKQQINKEDQLEKLKQNMEFVVEKINSQEKDVKDAMDVLKTYLETSIENEENKKRVMELQKRQESSKVSDLRRDIDYIKKMLPTVAVQEFHSEFLDEYGDIKAEMTNIKQQVHRSNSTANKDKYDQYRYGNTSSVQGPGSNPGAAKEPTMPWLRSSSSTVQQSSSAPVPVPSVNTNANADKKRLPNWLTQSNGPAIPEWQRTSMTGSTGGPQQNGGSGPTSSNGSPTSTSPLNTNNNNSNGLNDSENGSHMNNFTSSDGSENIPYSQNFMDIVKMVQNGQTPPNVRTDINDKPEDPEKPFDVQGELGKKPKPWERKQAASGAQEDEPKSE